MAEVRTEESAGVAQADGASDDGPGEPVPAGSSPVPPIPPVVAARRRARAWPWLVVLPLLGALLLGGGAFAANRLAPSSYTATALVAVLPSDPAAEVSIPVAGIWAEVGGSEQLRAGVAGALDVSPAELASSVSVTQAPNAPIVTIAVTTPDADRSATWANAYADQLLAQNTAAPVPQYTLRQVAEAVAPPTGAALVSLPLMIAAAAIGLLLGLVLAQRIVRRRRRAAR
ncbi:hypothetical protein ACI797_01390 [Geodermatophilus sp. SYSU D00691]